MVVTRGDGWSNRVVATSTWGRARDASDCSRTKCRPDEDAVHPQRRRGGSQGLCKTSPATGGRARLTLASRAIGVTLLRPHRTAARRPRHRFFPATAIAVTPPTTRSTVAMTDTSRPATCEELAGRWLEAEDRATAEPGNADLAAAAAELGEAYDDAIRTASLEELRVA